VILYIFIVIASKGFLRCQVGGPKPAHFQSTTEIHYATVTLNPEDSEIMAASANGLSVVMQ
jgi:hypothetical protein